MGTIIINDSGSPFISGHQVAPQAPTPVAGFPATFDPSRPKYIQFFAVRQNPGHTGEHRQFEVMPGDQPPTVTGGYAKWTTVSRWQRVGLTQFQGYDPISLDVPILFDCVTDHAGDGPARLETDIAKLEWMAGRGVNSNSGTGPPPIVTCITVDSTRTAIPLLPFNYQQAEDSTDTSGRDFIAAYVQNAGEALENTKGMRWVITNISWDTSPVRTSVAHHYPGYRIRQAATVTLTQFVPGVFGGSNALTAAEHALTAARVSSHIVKKGETYLSIARKQGISKKQATAFATKMMRLNQTSKYFKGIRSINHPLPVGKPVKIPGNA